LMVYITSFDSVVISQMTFSCDQASVGLVRSSFLD
jgi:hypothetical protein